MEIPASGAETAPETALSLAQQELAELIAGECLAVEERVEPYGRPIRKKPRHGEVHLGAVRDLAKVLSEPPISVAI